MTENKKFSRQRKTLFRTIIDLAAHLTCTLVLAVWFYHITAGLLWPFMAFLGGVLVDVDHFLDYFLHFGASFVPVDFFTHRQKISGKCYIIFHSWEIIFVLWISSIFVIWLTPLVTAMTVHLLIDHFTSHRSNPLFYSLTYRIKHKFSFERMFPGVSYWKNDY